jgi:hypothetical protein
MIVYRLNIFNRLNIVRAETKALKLGKRLGYVERAPLRARVT